MNSGECAFGHRGNDIRHQEVRNPRWSGDSRNRLSERVSFAMSLVSQSRRARSKYRDDVVPHVAWGSCCGWCDRNGGSDSNRFHHYGRNRKGPPFLRRIRRRGYIFRRRAPHAARISACATLRLQREGDSGGVGYSRFCVPRGMDTMSSRNSISRRRNCWRCFRQTSRRMVVSGNGSWMKRRSMGTTTTMRMRS